ncbi:uncharacterized protein isoform X1 [Rhodnius prolixus]|uniref:uncharacterized protein isoform X1 n=1 Tax=Rhodnius prolixus TaxID=13249 RepID=UPI003D18F499
MTSHLTYLRAKHKTHFIIKLLKMDLRHFQSHLKRFYLSSLLKIANELFDSKGEFLYFYNFSILFRLLTTYYTRLWHPSSQSWCSPERRLRSPDIPQHLNTILSTFADDTAILSPHSDPLIAARALQMHINHLQDWLIKW